METEKSYLPKHQTITHPQSQKSKDSITLYGALSALTNQMTWFYGTTKDSMGMIDLAEMLFNQNHRKSKIYLTWDAASWHGSDALLNWMETINGSKRQIRVRTESLNLFPRLQARSS
jgi:hypothetical protein